jgi:hypothetical protein
MQRILSVIAAVLIFATPTSISAQQHPAAAVRRLPPRSSAAIKATAVDWRNGTLAKTLLRIRDARRGRIVESALTDKLGVYTFKGLEPGNYVVEMMGSDRTTIAATRLISANEGETLAVVVRLPVKPSVLEAILGQVAPAEGAPGSSEIRALTAARPPSAVQSVPAIVPAGPPVTEQ